MLMLNILRSNEYKAMTESKAPKGKRRAISMRKFFLRNITSFNILDFRTMDRLVAALGGDAENPKCDGEVSWSV